MIGWGGSMGRVKIPYYVVIKGRGYWRPHPRMRALGFQIVRCGRDGPERDQAEAGRRYPAGSVGAAFQSYIRTPDWVARAQLTRDKI